MKEKIIEIFKDYAAKANIDDLCIMDIDWHDISGDIVALFSQPSEKLSAEEFIVKNIRSEFNPLLDHFNRIEKQYTFNDIVHILNQYEKQ